MTAYQPDGSRRSKPKLVVISVREHDLHTGVVIRTWSAITPDEAKDVPNALAAVAHNLGPTSEEVAVNYFVHGVLRLFLLCFECCGTSMLAL